MLLRNHYYPAIFALFVLFVSELELQTWWLRGVGRLHRLLRVSNGLAAFDVRLAVSLQLTLVCYAPGNQLSLDTCILRLVLFLFVTSYLSDTWYLSDIFNIAHL